MPLMQRAHRRDEADRGAAGPSRADGLPEMHRRCERRDVAAWGFHDPAGDCRLGAVLPRRRTGLMQASVREPLGSALPGESLRPPRQGPTIASRCIADDVQKTSNPRALRPDEQPRRRRGGIRRQGRMPCANGPPSAGRGRLVFALDATMSRQPTWDLACRLQGEMFTRDGADRRARRPARLFSRPRRVQGVEMGVRCGSRLGALMTRIDCRGGNTQIGTGPRPCHRGDAPRAASGAWSSSATRWRRTIDGCAPRRASSLSLGVPVFVFQEGRDPSPNGRSARSRESAAAPGARFDAVVRTELAALLRAVAAYAAGGRRRPRGAVRPRRGGARLLLQQMDPDMSQIILGALALAGVLWLLKSYTKASPTTPRQEGHRWRAGVVAMAVAGLLAVRGRIDMAMPLFVFGAGLAGWLPGLPGMFGLRAAAEAKRAPGGARGSSRASSRWSSISTAGAMHGRVVAGTLRGPRSRRARPGRTRRAPPRDGGRSRFALTPRSLSRPPGARLA